MKAAVEFRRRAFVEARRYGGDPWVFVRELLQNSRDAGAGRVELTARRANGVERVVCRDDGCGMTFDHARRYLFTLYASSKSGLDDTAGRFGIGFWSVLRFEPERIVIRSAPTDGAGWQLEMTGDLERIRRRDVDMRRGTEVELVRRSSGVDLEAAVWGAVRRDARHLRRRGTDREILDVRVNARLATGEIELDPPAVVFTRPGLRGAAALADRPRVDLLAHGLRVRTAATLDELLTRPERGRPRPIAPEGLVPRVVLDSRRLRVLMARGDARTDRELRRLVSVGRRAVHRLVRDQLDRAADPGWPRRAWARWRELTAARWLRRAAAGLLGAALVVGAGGWWLAARGDGRRGVRAGLDGPAVAGISRLRGSILRLEAADGYRGPAADPLSGAPETIPLEYRPRGVSPMLGVFRVDAVDDDGRVVPPVDAAGNRPYLGAPCAASCLELVLDCGAVSGVLRLPVATGHLLDPASVRVEDGAATLWAAPDGGPLLEIETGSGGRVRYRTGPAPHPRALRTGPWPTLPESADGVVASVRGRAAGDAAETAARWVRRRVSYDTSGDTVDRHREAAARGAPFAERCLAIGAGDCDVQNALLAAVLARAGFAVRLAVGFVGVGGRPVPGLHAWVEVGRGDGVWIVADASRGPESVAPPRDRLRAAPDTDVESPVAADTARPAGRVGPGRRPFWGLMSLLGVAGLLGVAVVVWRTRGRWRVERVGLEHEPDLAGLVRGALARPEAYGQLPTVFSSPVIPLLGRPPISLDRARRLAGRGRLAVGTMASRLARLAAGAGARVIDAARPEGSAAAAALGATDLDRWDTALARGRTTPVTERLARAAARVGEDWQVVLGRSLTDDVAVLDGRLAGLRRRCRVVAVDEHGELWQRVERCAHRRPAMATLVLADRVAAVVPLPADRCRRMLARLAADAVVENAEDPP